MGNFDQFADSCQHIHTENVRGTGENCEYFAEYILHRGLQIVRREFIEFFLRLMARLRLLEAQLTWRPAGAQYALITRRAANV